MDGKIIIAEQPSLDRAAIILASMSPDMVADIISLVNLRGNSLTTALFSPNSTASGQVANRFLGVMSRDYIADQDFAEVWAGLSTVFLANLRNPNMGNDNYQSILEQAFNLPSEIAEPIAKKIETYDILGPKTGEAGAATESWLTGVSRSLYEGFRRAVNWGAGVLNTDWEIDQQQNWDADFLYEMKNLGCAVFDLNSRARLMKGQAAITASYGVMLTGDPSETGDSEADLLGDTLRPFTMRRMPSRIMGASSNASLLGMKSSAAKAKQVFSHGGVAVDGTPVSSQARNSHLANLIQNLGNTPAPKALAVGAGIGLAPTIVRALFKLAGGGQTGDAEDGLYPVRDVYGDPVADALAMGDIEPLARAIHADLTTDFSTGDPNLDDIAVGEMISELGDAALVGGPFSRLRANIAKRRAYRDLKRKKRRRGKLARIDAKQAGKLSRVQNRFADESMDAGDDYADMDTDDFGGGSEADDYSEME